MSGLFQDERFALRQLKKNPGFATVAILTLALGIGASTIIFSVVYNGVLFPFPYRSAERLTAIDVMNVDGKDGRGMYPLGDVKALCEGNHTFEDILAYGLWYVIFNHDHLAEMIKGVGATPNALEFWGVPPMLGRGFSEQDVQSGAPALVLLQLPLLEEAISRRLSGEHRTWPRRGEPVERDFSHRPIDLFVGDHWGRSRRTIGLLLTRSSHHAGGSDDYPAERIIDTENGEGVAFVFDG